MIYKYQLALRERQFLKLPKLSHILTVQVQRDTIQLWAYVDTKTQEIEDYDIRIYGTGQAMPDIKDLYYLDTVQLHGYVWHIFLWDGNLL